MKTFTTPLLILLLSVCAAGVQAQRYQPKHYLSVGAAGGYAQFFTNYPQVTTKGQPTFGLQLGYELRYRALCFQAGWETRYMANRSAYGNIVDIYANNVLDTQGKPVTLHYTVTDYAETERMVTMQVPLMVGFVSEKGFFLMGGVKLGGAVYSDVKASLNYSTEGIYPEYGMSMSEMPNHFYTNYSTSTVGKARTTFMSSAVLEIGCDVMHLKNSSQKVDLHTLKLSAFAEVGFNNPYKKVENSQLLAPDAQNAAQLVPQSVFNLGANSDYHFVPFSVGVKVTYLFLLSTHQCLGCKKKNR